MQTKRLVILLIKYRMPWIGTKTGLRGNLFSCGRNGKWKRTVGYFVDHCPFPKESFALLINDFKQLGWLFHVVPHLPEDISFKTDKKEIQVVSLVLVTVDDDVTLLVFDMVGVGCHSAESDLFPSVG